MLPHFSDLTNVAVSRFVGLSERDGAIFCLFLLKWKNKSGIFFQFHFRHKKTFFRDFLLLKLFPIYFLPSVRFISLRNKVHLIIAVTIWLGRP